MEGREEEYCTDGLLASEKFKSLRSPSWPASLPPSWMAAWEISGAVGKHRKERGPEFESSGHSLAAAKLWTGWHYLPAPGRRPL